MFINNFNILFLRFFKYQSKISYTLGIHMQSEPKVLIIDSDPEKGKELQAVLKFVNCAPLLVSDYDRWKERAGDCSGFLTVMIGSCETDARLSKIVGEIHDVDENLPIYLLSEKGKEPTITIDPGSCILGRLDFFLPDAWPHVATHCPRLPPRE